MDITKKMVRCILSNQEFKQRKERVLEELILQDCKNYKPCILPLIVGDMLFKDVSDAISAINVAAKKNNETLVEFISKYVYTDSEHPVVEDSINVTDVVNVSRDILITYRRSDSDYEHIATISFDSVGW